MINYPVLNEEYWYEIFDGIMVTSKPMLPSKYIASVSVIFKNNKNFEVPIDKQDNYWEETLHEFLLKYKDKVKTVSYNIDLEQIKDDISNSTNKFLTHYNL